MTESAKSRPLPQIEGYRIEGVLGRGATGVVYSAVQLAVDRPVAIKVLHPELARRKSAVRRLQREARTAARLAHPGIISAIDMGHTEDLWWYAMELVEGISLAERIEERGPMGEREALRFFLPLVEALQHASEAGVVHRDIKPANILVDAHGKARLVDLGLAFAEDDPMLTRAGGTLGTPHYISPEQARDPASADTRSDLWSLGATMYHAVTGRPPFEGESVAEILSGVLYARVSDPRLYAPSLSKGFTLILRKCLSRDPEGRYSEPRELLEDMQRVVERRSPAVSARTLDPLSDEGPPWRRWALVGSAVGLVALLIIAWHPWRGSRPRPVDSPAAVLEWPALERLRESYEGGGLPLADALQRLGQLEAPKGAEALRSRLRGRLELDLDRAIEKLARDLVVELERAFSEGRIARAKELLEGAGDRLEQATGYADTASLPVGPARRRLERLLESRRVQLSQTRRAARLQGEQALATYLDTFLIPRIEAARDAYHWRTARSLLDSRAEWLEAAGISQDLLPEDRQQVLDAGEDRLLPVRTTLYDHYERTVRDLEEYLDHEEEELRKELGAARMGVADELRARFDARLTSLGIDPGEIPADYAVRLDPRSRLEELASGLEADEERILEQDARKEYAADLARARVLLHARRYDQALELWEARLSQPWRSSVHATMQLRRREAELLEGLLQRAAAGLRAAHGRRIELTLGGIIHQATVVATRSPTEIAESGVELRLDKVERSLRIFLRRGSGADGEAQVLPAETLLTMAGVGEQAKGEDAFVRALFLYHEGSLDGARAALPQGPIEDTVLLMDLGQRIDDALAMRRRVTSGRQDEAERRLRALHREVESGRTSPMGILDQGRALLAEYVDVLSVEQRRDVEGICDDCERALASKTISERYPRASVLRRNRGMVTLSWDFAETSGGAWQRGDWEPAPGGTGLRLAGERSSQEEFWSREHALRLPLDPPLDPGQPLRLRLTLRWGEDHAAFDNDLVLSLAGRHLLFVDGPPNRTHRWAVTQEDPREALVDLRQGPRPRFGGFEGFPRDREFELSIELAAERGELAVSVDGVPLEMPRELRKVPLPARPELVLRSWYVVEVRQVELEGRLR